MLADDPWQISQAITHLLDSAIAQKALNMMGSVVAIIMSDTISVCTLIARTSGCSTHSRAFCSTTSLGNGGLQRL